SRDFLDEDREGEVVEAGTTVHLRNQDTQQAQFGRLLHQISRELVKMIDRLSPGFDFALREVTDELSNLLLFGAERKVHSVLHGPAPLRTRTMVASPCAMPEQMPTAPDPPPRRRSS